MTLLGLKKPVEPALPVLGKLQEKFFLVTTMLNVPQMTRYIVAMCSWHIVNIRLLLINTFKIEKDPCLQVFYVLFRIVVLVRPHAIHDHGADTISPVVQI